MKTDNKTIGITLRFFTNDLPEKIGKGLKQTPFWNVGTAILEGNKTKGIKADQIVFHSMEEIPAVVKEIMRRAKLTMVCELKGKK